MDDRDFVKSIKSAVDLSEKLGLFEYVSIPTSLHVDKEFRDTVLSNEASYIDVYRKGLQLRHYNFMLKDFSYFQFSKTGDAYRYAYYSNPYDIEGADIGLDDMEIYFEMLSNARELYKRPLIRYEYAESQYTEFHHPCSHFHIGLHTDNRWASSKRLTPLAFGMMIFRLYYCDQWAEHNDDGNMFKNSLNEKLSLEKAGCVNLPDELFTPQEKKIFYFS